MKARSSTRTSSASAIAIRRRISSARAAISSAACWRGRSAIIWRTASSSTAARPWYSWIDGRRGEDGIELPRIPAEVLNGRGGIERHVLHHAVAHGHIRAGKKRLRQAQGGPPQQ